MDPPIRSIVSRSPRQHNRAVVAHMCGVYRSVQRSEVRLKEGETAKISTTIAAEVRFLDQQSRNSVLEASPVPPAARLDELVAFQSWMDLAASTTNPAVVRAQVIVQNYVCFIYLGESCFRALRKASKAGSLTRRCCEFLTDNPVRA